MSRPKTERSAGTLAAIVTLGTMLAGCSDLYVDRRDAIALGAGDAVAANQMAQMYDPWPRQSGNPNFASNGQRMQSAVARYRAGGVTQPADPMALQGALQMSAMGQTSSSQSSSSSNNGSSSSSGSPSAATNSGSSAANQ